MHHASPPALTVPSPSVRGVRAAKSSLYVWGFAGDGQAGERLRMPTQASPMRVTALSDKEVRDVACGPDHLCVTVATHWIRDDETTKCMLCGVAFTVMNRRVRAHRHRSHPSPLSLARVPAPDPSFLPPRLAAPLPQLRRHLLVRATA